MAADFNREQLIETLKPTILEALRRCDDLALEAIVDGRVGLNEMSDEELVSFARDCYQVDV